MDWCEKEPLSITWALYVCAGSKFSFDPSIDDGMSPHGSRRSLAETSVTSTADLSVFSSATRSQALDNSLDTQSNMSVGSSGSGGLPTPRASSHQPSPDVVRIYVPYSSPSPASCNDRLPCTLPRTLDTNKIRIRVDPDKTPVVENLKPFSLESPDYELDIKWKSPDWGRKRRLRSESNNVQIKAIVQFQVVLQVDFNCYGLARWNEYRWRCVSASDRRRCFQPKLDDCWLDCNSADTISSTIKWTL